MPSRLGSGICSRDHPDLTPITRSSGRRGWWCRGVGRLSAGDQIDLGHSLQQWCCHAHHKSTARHRLQHTS
uniref:Uncharacterized protein n=1 Tax=Arundo donax TaxID=35708 RepID=A0A0A8ZSN8_ARUDO